MLDNDALGAGPVWAPGAQLAGFIKRNVIYCYTHNMKALGLEAWEKNIFFVRLLKLMAHGEGLFLPKAHDFQDLCKAPHNNAAY